MTKLTLNSPAKINFGLNILNKRDDGFHNLKTFFSNDIDSSKENDAFDEWLIETCANPAISTEEREKRLIEWEQAPFARFCHPREEHLLPLHVCYGIACAGSPIAKTVFNGRIMGKKVTSFLW